MWYEKKTPLLPVLYYHTSLILAYMQYTNMLKYTVYGSIDLTVVQQKVYSNPFIPKQFSPLLKTASIGCIIIEVVITVKWIIRIIDCLMHVLNCSISYPICASSY